MHYFIAMLILMLASIWVFIDARDKGRSEGQALLWALGTIMALIIFLPLWLFVRSQGTQPKYSRTCSFCRHSFGDIPKARYCPYCGSILDRYDHSKAIDIDFHKNDDHNVDQKNEEVHPK